jgi:ribosomal protein L31
VKRQHVIALLALAGAAAAFVWWKKSAAPGSTSMADNSSPLGTPGYTSLAGNNLTNSSSSMPAAAAAVIAAATAANPPINSGGTDTANTTDSAPANNASADYNMGPGPTVPSGPNYALTSVFQSAYETFLGKKKKKHTDGRLMRFEKKYERKHNVEVGSAAPTTSLT